MKDIFFQKSHNLAATELHSHKLTKKWMLIVCEKIYGCAKEVCEIFSLNVSQHTLLRNCTSFTTLQSDIILLVLGDVSQKL